MGIWKIPKDYKKLMEAHGRVLQDLRLGAVEDEISRQQVKDAGENMVKDALFRLLSLIPVEEVNRDKLGIRVTALRSSGFETILDIQNATAQSLANVSGISDEGAREIKVIAAGIAASAEGEIHIRLSADEKTPDATALLKALSVCRNIKEPAMACESLLKENEEPVHTACQNLLPFQKSLQWLFVPKVEKQKAQDAYEFLKNAWDNGYVIKAGELKNQRTAIQSPSDDFLWQSFTENPVSYFNLLEEICPGLLGNEDDKYGLPQELAKYVEQEQLNLEGLRCQLRKYQEWGVKYILKQKKVLLGDEMGLGKTVQAIAAMVSLFNGGATHFLVVCPASVIENWIREIRKHSPLSAVKIHGDDKEDALQQWIRDGGVAVTNFESAKIFDLPQDFSVSLAVVDEAHYIKNPRAQRTQHVKSICTHAQRQLFMTGTAMENRVEEMITLISMLQPEIAQEADRMAALATAPQFRDIVAPVYYRRKRDQVLKELPELIDTPEWCRMGKSEERIYEEAVLEGHYTEARRVSWNAPAVLDSSKAQRMLEIIEEAREEGRKVIVFSFFLKTIASVVSLLGENCLTPIDGSIPLPRRQEIIDEFTAAPAGTVLAAQIQAGGTGLNIQSASVVILCEPQLKPSIENQAISRAYRMGQTRNVLVYRLLCEDTVDDKIMDMLSDKQAEFDTFADESSAAQKTLELDSSSLQSIMQDEARRIQEKNGLTVLPSAEVQDQTSQAPVAKTI